MLQTMEEALQAIDEGKILAVYTDTVLGFIADGTNKQTVEELYSIKKRDRSKPYIIFVSEKEDIAKYAKNIPSYAQKFMQTFWPGQLTCIFQVKKMKENTSYLANQNSVGIRIPNEPHLLELLKKTDKTIISTSANISEDNELYALQQVQEVFGDSVVCWDYSFASLTNEQASTIIDCTKKDTWQLVREGSITKEMLWQVIDNE